MGAVAAGEAEAVRRLKQVSLESTMHHRSWLWLLLAWLILISACSSNATSGDSFPISEGKPTIIPSAAASPTAIILTHAVTARAITPNRKIVTVQPQALRPTDTPQPAVDVQHFKNVWKTYTNTEYGFSFEYPAIYDHSPYDRCAVITRTISSDFSLEDIYVGARTWLYIKAANGENLQQHYQKFLDSAKSDPQFMVASYFFSDTGKIAIGAHGEPELTLEYRFGSMGRYGRVTFVKHQDQILEIHFTAGVFCDVPEIGLSEVDVALRVLSSLRFSSDYR